MYKMPFCHLIQYPKFRQSTIIAKAQKISANTTGIKFNFGIQIPKGTKNRINLDKKNGNNLREEAIKTELKQIIDYQRFIVLDSGERIPTDYQKIP
jgi:hypothetical protein